MELSRPLKFFLIKTLSILGYKVLKNLEFNRIHADLDRSNSYIKWSENLAEGNFRNHMRISLLGYASNAQMQQDLIALYVHTLHSKEPGYFVEFGATDGKTYSNTLLLEDRFSWTGILAEPAKRWQRDLELNRNCVLDTRCVWRKTGEMLEFFEVQSAEYSTLAVFSENDRHAGLRTRRKSYFVETVTLEDLLNAHNAPKTISYLSVDTEGSELEIIRGFNFHKYDFNFITIEHNYSNNRQAIFDLLSKNGYRRILSELSEWDDWYVRECEETKGFLRSISAED